MPPSIRTSPSNGQLTARKGGSITLECKASGNPVPSILWSRKVSESFLFLKGLNCEEARTCLICVHIIGRYDSCRLIL